MKTPVLTKDGDFERGEARRSAWRRRCEAAERKVLEQVREYGGFSIFWGTENMDRARAIERLHRKKGLIAPKKGKAYGRFPWCGYRIVKPTAQLCRTQGALDSAMHSNRGSDQ